MSEQNPMALPELRIEKGEWVVFGLPTGATYLGRFISFVDVPIKCKGLGVVNVKKACISVSKMVSPLGEVQLPILHPCWIAPLHRAEQVMQLGVKQVHLS